MIQTGALNNRYVLVHLIGDTPQDIQLTLHIRRAFCFFVVVLYITLKQFEIECLKHVSN